MNIPSQRLQQTAAASVPSKSDRPERKTWEQLLIGLEDQVLIECYHSAVEMRLEDDFIAILRKEIEERGIEDRMPVLEDSKMQDFQSV